VKVFFTSRARRRAAVLMGWWREHRPAAPDLFVAELTSAIELLGSQPGAGAPYATREAGGKGEAVAIRRLLLRETEQYLYYAVDPAAARIVIHTIWGARRRHGPNL